MLLVLPHTTYMLGDVRSPVNLYFFQSSGSGVSRLCSFKGASLFFGGNRNEHCSYL